MRRTALGGLVSALLLATTADWAAAADEQEVGVSDRTDLLVTVYNRDLGLVRDTRKVDLAAGDSLLALQGLSPQLQPETLLIEAKGLTFNTQVLPH